jgi:hypothetical protein
MQMAMEPKAKATPAGAGWICRGAVYYETSDDVSHVFSGCYVTIQSTYYDPEINNNVVTTLSGTANSSGVYTIDLPEMNLPAGGTVLCNVVAVHVNALNTDSPALPFEWDAGELNAEAGWGSATDPSRTVTMTQTTVLYSPTAISQ